MKRVMFILLAAALLLGVFSACDEEEGRPGETATPEIVPAEIGAIEHFFFTESNGSDFDRRVEYRLDYTRLENGDGYYVAVVKPEEVKADDTLTVNTDREFADRLEQALRENGVGNWNGYHEMDTDILDGIGFTLRVDMANGEVIDAVGYMEWPEGYGRAAGAIHELFLELYENNR